MLSEYKKILVGLDGSVESTKAFDKAVALAKEQDSELVLASVIELRTYSAVGTYLEDHQRGVELFLKDFADEAKAAGLTNVKTIMEYGAPKVMLGVTIPKHEEVDLIVLGVTGLNLAERLFMGSVAKYVINNAPCDTLVVR